MGIRLSWFTKPQNCTENEGGVVVLAWIKTVDPQSQCHWKLGEQQLNSSTVCALLFISMSIYPLSAANTRRSTDAELMLAQRLRRGTNINQALVQIFPTAVSVGLLVVIWCVIYMYLGHAALFLVDVQFLPQWERPILSVCRLIIQRLSHWFAPLLWICVMRAPG